MTTLTVSVSRSRSEDETAFRALLESVDLPTADLDDESSRSFLVARAETGEITGVVGLEIHGRDGLLRSLAVTSSARGTGLGERLTREIEALARSEGVEVLYLLTTTAAGFFPRFGFQPTERTDVPAEIAATAEFASLCPASAVCLSKSLGT